ncbi:MAG: hypothetical protein H8E32_11590 [Nitrospinae bacterium]|nr:hypothetical protein [Nitrospinota bacterium]
MNNRSWVENIIGAIIVLNFVVLALVFLIPRAKVIVNYWGWESAALMQTSGAMDTPNQYLKTYKVANQIRNVTKENSIILMPADNWEFGSNRSVVIQRLYPRRVYFFGDKNFSEFKFNLNSTVPVYGVAFSGDGAELCFEKDVKKLGETGFEICKRSFSN